jgi:outer membrane protein OmpA-like peptidoglycan-associated protein
MKNSVLLVLCLFSYYSWAQVNFVENTTIMVEEVSLNTYSSDFGPSFVAGELWFSAFAPDKIINFNQGKTKNLFYNLFAAPVNENGDLLVEKKLKLEEISSGYHAGPVSFCQKTNELFVTLSNYENAEIKNVVFQKKNIPLKIVVLEKSGNDWSHALELPFNSSSYSVGHPAISPTGDTLIFASDIASKGMGGTDLYMTVRKNGKWGEMTNLGKKINTAGDDMFPFFHRGKTLFFASNGKQGGKGGFDIWYSNLTESGFEEPKNLESLNTAADDFGLVIHPNEEVGYFVSNKAGGKGDDDIYKVLFDGAYQLELTVRNRKTMEPMPGIKVEFNNSEIFTTDGTGIIKREIEKRTDYTAKPSLEGFMNESVSFSTKNLDYGTLKKEIQIEKAEVGQKFVMKNIYYHFDKWNILPESEVELHKLVKVLNDNPSWTVELGSHTDSRGTHDYNDLLSLRRSESATNYIISQGITKNRILAKGYGERVLINNCKDGVHCSEEQHQENRRTEFTILGMDSENISIR